MSMTTVPKGTVPNTSTPDANAFKKKKLPEQGAGSTTPAPGQSEPGAEPGADAAEPEKKKGLFSGMASNGFGFDRGSTAEKLDTRITDSMSASAGPRAAQVEDRLDDGQALLNPGASTGIQGAPVSRAAAPGIDMDSDVTARVIKLLQGV